MTIPQLRKSAREIWEAALAASDPDVCIRSILKPSDRGFSVAGTDVEVGGRLVVIGAGKASPRMAQTIEDLFGDRIWNGLIVTKYGHGLPMKKIEIVEAGHPVPDGNGVTGVLKIHQLIFGLEPSDVVICLISGGGSALLPAPADDITLDEKQEVTSKLLRAGATIRELNTIRKHLSSMKGGQLAQLAYPARVVALIFSDVIGDFVDVIASGPTAPDTSTFSDAHAILEKYRVSVPEAVKSRITRGARGEIPDTPKPGNPVFANVSNHVIGNNRVLVDSAARKAKELGFNTLLLSTGVEGEARDVGRVFAAIAREVATSGNPVPSPACILAAGETTVTVRGDGMGGRNQEMTMAWAISMQSWFKPACFVSLATDGTDGPTDAAGGLVDPFTCARAAEFGIQAAKRLRANDSYNFLKVTSDLIKTGPTRTNLMDLQILLVG